MKTQAPFDQIIALDFETAWGRKVGLGFSCQTNEEYIRDPRFKAWGLSWKTVGTDENPVWVRHDRIKRWAAGFDWSRTAILCQNTQFDGSILAWHYGVLPCFMFDTLSMGRALFGVEVGNSLKALAERFELPPKGDGLSPSENILEDLPFHVEQTLADYCKHDTWLCEQIFLRMRPQFPTKELKLIDMTLRMYVRPLLELDKEMLSKAIDEERSNREGLLQRIGVEEAALASNEKFAEALRALAVEPPTKISKTTGEETWALAKNDALFQALLNHDNEDVALLCQARLKVKSTTERTRAQRFLDIATRGALPVPLSYYGAATGRWTAAKGSAINMQNLKRGSFLRKAIMAPEEHVLVVGDLSQIEPRVLAWMADYENLLNIFRTGKDAYAQFGAQMFNIPGMTQETHPVERQSAKSALLGCFGADTLVLTNRGWLPIVKVQVTDKVWDGTEWVCHQGVVQQGEKEVLTAHGISATSDHEILTERGWQEWSAVLAAPSLFQSARSLVNLPVSGGSANSTSKDGGVFTHACAVLVDGKALCTEVTCSAELQPGVIVALKEKPSRRAGSKKGTLPSAQTGHTEIGYSTASAQSSFAAQIQKASCTPTMVDAALRFIRHGLKTASSFCATSLASMVGISLRSSLTVLTTTGAMFPAIFGSLPAAKTWRTNDASPPETLKRSNSASPFLKQRMQTYDIAYAGPRNRYTILTNDGPLIVHNCGYQLGWASFAAQLLTGFLGAAPKRYTKEEAKQLGVTGADVDKFLSWEVNVKAMQEIPHTCTERELLIHCLAAKAIIDKYRATSTPVVAFWKLLDDLISHSLYKGKEYTHKCLTFRKEEIILPSGMSLRYPDLRPEEDSKGRVQWTYADGRDGKKRTKLYAGKVCNNVVQGTARCVMTDGMLRIAKRYPVVGTVHDECLAVAPESEKDEAKQWCLAQMTIVPAYLPGIPLAASGGVHRRYGLAKN